MFQEQEFIELPLDDVLQHAKKHPHTHVASSQAFAVNHHDIVIHNLSMKGDPQEMKDIINYRRGLTLMNQIVDFQDLPLRIARKGLRKFHDLLPEYLELKHSHISTNRFHGQIKQNLFDSLKDASSYKVYVTRKSNGENAQISYDQPTECWVFGSKNKTLLLKDRSSMKYINHRHQHLLTIQIAEIWFDLIQNLDIEAIKKDLSRFTLIGEHCNSVKNAHIMDYGEGRRIYFYSMVDKNNRVDNCLPTSFVIKFLRKHQLQDTMEKYNIEVFNTHESLIEYLKKQVMRIFQSTLQSEGEGVVLYICGVSETEEEKCLSVHKIKTLQYRIYRKLREKLKVYMEKPKKNYQKILNQLLQEIKQLTRGFTLPHEMQFYQEKAIKAFELCSDQTKMINKFICNKFVLFMKILQKEKISKQKFLQIVNSKQTNETFDKINEEMVEQPTVEKQKNQEENKNNEQRTILIFIPITIPSTGKSSVFSKFLQFSAIPATIISSDSIREEVMNQKLKRNKSMTKKEAYEKSRKQANQKYYERLRSLLKEIEKKDSKEYLIILDKNHPQSALKPAIEQIHKSTEKLKNIKVKIVGVLPFCKIRHSLKGKYDFPFSLLYMATCLKRVLSRQQHQTLEGSEQQRCNICVGFAALFRNFSPNEYNLSRYFDQTIQIPFHNDQNEMNQRIEELLTEILIQSKPGSFQEHSKLPNLVQELKKWYIKEIEFEKIIPEVQKRISKVLAK